MAGTDKEDPKVVDAEIVDPEPAPAAPAPAPQAPAAQTPAPATPAPSFGTPSFAAPAPDYSEGGVPSFDYVRDRIENRTATAAGSAELAGLGGSGPTVEELDKKLADRDKAGKDKLAEIRRAMGLE